MDLAHYKSLLQDKEQALLDHLDRTEAEARETPDRDAPEAMERMVNQEGQDSLLQHTNADYHQLTDVQAALARIEDGTFGKCIDCGREIEPKRLEAVPWSAYCLEDQEKHDREAGATGAGLTM